MAKKTEDKELPAILDSAQLGAYLGMSRGALRTACSRGLVPPGRRIAGLKGLRWRKADIAAWIERSLEGAA